MGSMMRKPVLILLLVSFLSIGLYASFSVYGGLNHGVLNSESSRNGAEVYRPKAAGTKIWMMTSLPIIWGEAQNISEILQSETVRAPVYNHLQKTYDIAAVDSLKDLDGQDIDLVLLAQPAAMDPADLRDLDIWIRKGGRALILADPVLHWPTDLPLGHQNRPLASSLLSPLLGHWGLVLQAPEPGKPVAAPINTGGVTVQSHAIGQFRQARPDDATPSCELTLDRQMAICSMGCGHALLVADADFLDDRLQEEPGSDPLPPAHIRLLDEMIGRALNPKTAENGKKSPSDQQDKQCGDERGQMAK